MNMNFLTFGSFCMVLLATEHITINMGVQSGGSGAAYAKKDKLRDSKRAFSRIPSTTSTRTRHAAASKVGSYDSTEVSRVFGLHIFKCLS